MGIEVRLIGRPQIIVDGAPADGPRGRKAWGLLAFLLLNPRPVYRRQLAELLFSEAADPLAALRWNLAELRRVTRRRDAFRGDPIVAELGPKVIVDVETLTTAPPETLADTDVPAGTLLEGLHWPAAPAFEAWMQAERRGVAMALESALRERALLALAAGRLVVASRSAARLVAMNPYEAGHHELLVRSLLRSGDVAGAAAQIDACTRLFRDELCVEPPPRLAELVTEVQNPQGASATAVDATATARARLRAGRAALAAGALDTGIAALRRASHDASATRDAQLRAAVLLELGSGLVHAMRCHEEAATVLHEAAVLAERVGDARTAAQALREIGFIDVQAGRRQRARNWLARAAQVATDEADVLASIRATQGMEFSDAAQYRDAVSILERAADDARTAGAQRSLALATSLLGRVRLLTGNDTAARTALCQSLDAVDRSNWVAFRPWPETLLAETELHQGRFDVARDRLDGAFALACEFGDPCWEAVAARGLGLLEYRRQHARSAIAWLLDAYTRCTRPASPYQWLNAWILDALVTVKLAHQAADARRWLDELESLATRTGMREFTVRAMARSPYRGHSGQQSDAIAAARAIASGIDNPALHTMLDG